MNGKVAKRLRRIARELKLDPENKYAPVGEIRHAEARRDHKGRAYTAGIVRRPFALQACERRAYLEAKAIYKGENTAVAEVVTPGVSFESRMRASIDKQPEGPV